MIKKLSGEYRFCLDFRKVNKITKKDLYRISSINEILDTSRSAVVWAIIKFRLYLEGCRFQVITDHIALKWLHNTKNPTRRLARRALELLESDYEVIIYRKENLNLVADGFSRSNKTTKSTAFALECCIEKPKAEINAVIDNWYSEKMRQVRKRPEDHVNWGIMDS